MQRLAGYQPADCPYPELNKAGVLRGTHIGGIILTDSQIDHTTGLLSLREGCPHQVWCTPEVHEDLSTGFPVFTMLRHWNGGPVSSHRSAAAFYRSRLS